MERRAQQALHIMVSIVGIGSILLLTEKPVMVMRKVISALSACVR